jgi:uncharacterized protein (TIGR00369 family)
MHIERLNELMRIFNEKAPIARTFGMQLSYDEEGCAVIELPYNACLDHALGGVHGGVYMTMLDSAGWFTVAASHEQSSWLATSEISVHFLEPVSGMSLSAEGRMIKNGKRQAVAEMRLYNEKGRLVAHATGTFVKLAEIQMG